MASKKFFQFFKEGLIRGVGWAFGVTIGFIIISSILVIVLRQAGGIPLVGKWIASIVGVTLEQLAKRAPFIPQ